MEREDILDQARFHASRHWADGKLPEAVAEFVGQCRVLGLDPPIHHASITHAVLMAEKGDIDGVHEWLTKQK
jgi:hypothetical protein